MVWRVSQMDEKGNDQLNRIGLEYLSTLWATVRFHLRDCFSGLPPDKHSLRS